VTTTGGLIRIIVKLGPIPRITIGLNGENGVNVLKFVEKLESNHGQGIAYLLKMEDFLVQAQLTKNWLLVFQGTAMSMAVGESGVIGTPVL